MANLKFKKSSNPFDVEKLSRSIENAYLAQRRPAGELTKKTFAPSGIGYGHNRCARYWYQAFNGANFEDTVDAVGVANMSNGSFTHERVQKIFEETGLLVEQEREVKLESPPIRGFVDVIIKMDGEEVVGEIKSTNSRAFSFRQNSMSPSINHLYQILIYLKATGINKGFMYYENKDDQTFLIIPVTLNERNEKIINDAFEWLRRVRKNWEDGEGTNSHIPQRAFTRKSVSCKGCPLYRTCWPVDSDGQPDEITEVPMSDVVIEAMAVPKI